MLFFSKVKLVHIHIHNIKPIDSRAAAALKKILNNLIVKFIKKNNFFLSRTRLMRKQSEKASFLASKLASLSKIDKKQHFTDEMDSKFESCAYKPPPLFERVNNQIVIEPNETMRVVSFDMESDEKLFSPSTHVVSGSSFSPTSFHQHRKDSISTDASEKGTINMESDDMEIEIFKPTIDYSSKIFEKFFYYKFPQPRIYLCIKIFFLSMETQIKIEKKNWGKF